MGSEEFYNMMMIKGKRSKRQRQLLAASSSSLALTMATSSSSTSSSDQQFNNNNCMISCDDDKTTQVEQDMANCLILLAQGGQSRKLPTTTTSTSTIKDLFMYQCKTCDRSFPSFQALGGHRASHKRPKAGSTTEPSSINQHETSLSIFNHDASICTTNTILSLQISSSRSDHSCGIKPSNATKSSSKVHECSICGAEFTSGQALGGHMRRHRSSLLPRATMPSPNHESDNEMKKPSAANVFSLDLNLPAPEDMDQQIESKFPFAMNQQVIVFSPSALVDCHL